jgi:hypothetical protein
LAAQIPATPAQPLTIWHKETDEVEVDWVEPGNGGSPIFSYTLSVRESDLITYTTLPLLCEGSIGAQNVTATNCRISVTQLIAEPFILPWGSQVYAKVFATNFYGDSLNSAAGFGAIITTYPDPPINLIEDYSKRSPTTLGFTWEPAAFTGGAVIIDY